MTTVVVDTSAIIAVLKQERRCELVAEALEDATERLISAATMVELGIVAESINPTVTAQRIVRDFKLTVVDVTQVQADRALDGWRRFGKGRHRAALNFGDCFTFALAEERGVGIVAVGEDFVAAGCDVVP